jgi:hypothetical protein
MGFAGAALRLARYAAKTRFAQTGLPHGRSLRQEPADGSSQIAVAPNVLLSGFLLVLFFFSKEKYGLRI